MLTADQLTAVIDKIAAEAGDHEEQGPNRGSCNKYQLAGGGVPGDSWCMDLQIWAEHEVLGYYDLPRSGSCEEQRVYARRHGTLDTDPAYGAVGLVIGANGRAHHAFRVSSIPDQFGTFESWAGNTNDNGSRDGTGVYPKVRGTGDGLTYEYLRR